MIKLPSLERMKMVAALTGPLFSHSSRLQDAVNLAESKYGEVTGLAGALKEHWAKATDALTQLGLLKDQMPPEVAAQVEIVQQAAADIMQAAADEATPVLKEAVDDQNLPEVTEEVADGVVVDMAEATETNEQG